MSLSSAPLPTLLCYNVFNFCKWGHGGSDREKENLLSGEDLVGFYNKNNIAVKRDQEKRFGSFSNWRQYNTICQVSEQRKYNFHFYSSGKKPNYKVMPLMETKSCLVILLI